jgi:hypothetical protein
MTFPANPAERSPKGDHNRRLALAIDPDVFAAQAGITVEALREYEQTPPDGNFDPVVAQRVGEALEMMEALKEPRVDNGPIPTNTVTDLAPLGRRSL